MSSQNLKIIPTSNNLIALRLDVPDKSPGGIVIPEVHRKKETSRKAKVLCIGEKVLKIKPGFIVIFPDYAGIEIEHEGTKYLFLEERDILGYYYEDT